MSGVSRKSKARWAGGKDCVGEGRSEAGRWVDQLSPKQENQANGRGVKEKQAEVNSNYCLPKDQHNRGISGIGAGEFHVIGQFIWRHALQHQLASIGIFTFVSFQRDVKQPNSNYDNKEKDQAREHEGEYAYAGQLMLQ